MGNNEKELNARDVLAELIAYREAPNQVEENKKSSWLIKASFWIWVFGVVVVSIGYVVVQNKITIPAEYVLVYLIVFLVSLVATVIVTFLDVSRDKDVRSFLKAPVADLLKTSDKILKGEIALYAKLDKYSLGALIQTRNFLARKKSLVESLSSMLVGVLTKVGLLPAVFGVLVVIAKLNSDGGFSLMSFAAFALVGIYFFCFRLIEASVKFEEYQSILSDYIEMRKL